MRTPHRLQVGTSYEDAISLLNDNFEKSIQDISDLGASSTTTTSFITNSVAAGATFNKTISILQAGSSPAADSIILTERANGLRGAMPAIDIFVDSTGVDYLYPTGQFLSTGQQALIANSHINITEQGSGMASLVFSLRNCDSSAHSYNISIKLVYIPEVSNG